MEKKKTVSNSDLLLDLDFGKENSRLSTVKVSKPVKAENQLKIAKKQKQVLSKNQQTFNKLIKKIETFEAKIEQTKKLALELTAVYSKDILPVEKKLGTAYFDFAFMLDRYVQNLKLTKTQQNDFDECVGGLCDNGLTYLEPDDSQEALYNKYSEESYKEKLENQKLDLFEQFRKYMEEEMGVDVGDMDFDMTNEEEALKYSEKLKEQLENKLIEEEEKELNKKKTKKQIEAEQVQKLEEELSKKSLRSIYISLAKMLHPDTETDEKLILDKTELMKKVTVAYDQKDLATLLKLEMEWVHRTSDNLLELTEETLKLYNKVLSEQVDELKQEIFHIKMNPAYVNISQWLDYTPKYALSCLKEQKKDLLYEVTSLKKDEKIFQKQPAQKSVLIKYLKDTMEYGNDDDDVFGQMLYNSFL